MKIRRLKLEDLSDIIAFSKRAYGYEEEQRHLDDLRDLTKNVAEGFANEPEGMFVAESDGVVVGTMFAFAKEQPAGQGSLGWVGVDPAHQGRGIGRKLLAKAEAYLRSKGVKRIVCGTDRPRAMPFYVSQGYGIVNCTMMKHVEKPRRRTRVQRIIEAIEEYAAFRFTHHNLDHVTGAVTKALRSKTSRAKRIEALTKIAEVYVVYPVTENRAAAFRRKLNTLLRSA